MSSNQLVVVFTINNSLVDFSPELAWKNGIKLMAIIQNIDKTGSGSFRNVDKIMSGFFGFKNFSEKCKH